jgi:cellulose synthase/poly-beta-1,6-N-acetylglucosamine synthase-like glycosyltransferase
MRATVSQHGRNGKDSLLPPAKTGLDDEVRTMVKGAMANEEIAEATRTAEPAASPAVTVVVVSDYLEGRQKSWTDERAVLHALGHQDFLEPFEVILMENETVRGSSPADLLSRCPGSRIEFSEATTSAGLKDAGVKRANGELIAILEADCIPAPDWLRHMVSALRGRPDYAAASGKTLYPGRSIFVRCLTLLDRSVYPGGSGPTASISNNNSIVRRGVLDRYPYPASPSPFLSAALRWRAMQRDGLRCFFESHGIVYHALPSWSFIKDMRRHVGYSLGAQSEPDVRTLLRDLTRGLYYDIMRCWRLRQHYAVAAHELPLAYALAVVVKFYEFKGARSAQKRGLPRTAYR